MDGDGLVRSGLPRGRHRLSPEQVAEDQRRRLLAAMAESVASRGYAATSVERVIELAGVSRASFYKLFDNRHDCLLAAYDAVFEAFVAEVSAACRGEAAWRDRVAAAIAAALEFVVRRPAEARLLALDAIAVDGTAAHRALEAAERLVAMLRTGRDHCVQAADLPEVTERALLGAVASVVNWCLLKEESLTDLEPQLVQLVLTPYIGPAAAAQQAAKAGGAPSVDRAQL